MQQGSGTAPQLALKRRVSYVLAQRGWMMRASKIGAVIGLGLLASLAKSGEPARMVENVNREGRAGTEERLAGAAERFRKLCVSCHGGDGKGRKSRNRLNIPDFTAADWQTSRTDGRLVASILNGRGDHMPAFDDRLSDDQARELVAFIRTFGPGTAKSTAKPVSDFEKRFQELQREYEELEKQIKALRPAR
jgi:mono/diheme cytochrome c family protein